MADAVDLITTARELEELLRAEAGHLERVAERLEGDRRALIAGEGRLLAAAAGAWQELAAARADADRRRALLLDRLARRLGAGAAKLTVSRIAAALPPGPAAALRRAGAAARRAARQAALEAAVGGDLLAEAARFQEGLLRALAGAAPGGAGYGPEREERPPALSLLDAVG